ncbi:heavy-metal-associated domain-containing protein [uncultured Alsobacter sp.]|uniref:heavy-metal-associated domain-containing protein n=1 Tax=uncultured Alsobacter sp. TaxID=1748258 RepID=UPI0025F17C55|nr:heavy metal-associated domain-containing protein [uncultured Alsobacter sp.]
MTDSRAETVFDVPDMSCQHCVATISKALAAEMPGVPVAIDLAKHEVRVSGDAARAEHVIRDAGYEPSRRGA